MKNNIIWSSAESAHSMVNGKVILHKLLHTHTKAWGHMQKANAQISLHTINVQNFEQENKNET